MLPEYEFNQIKKRLSILGLKNLDEFYKTAYWKKLKIQMRKLHNGKLICECCTITEKELLGHGCKMHLHHNNYKNLGRESPNDLNWLCENCHEDLHIRTQEIIEMVKKDEGLLLQVFWMMRFELDSIDFFRLKNK